MSTLRVTVVQMPDSRDDLKRAWQGLVDHHRVEQADLVVLNEVPFDAWFGTEPSFDQSRWDDAVVRHRKGLERLGELGTTVLGTAPNEMEGRRYNQAFLHTPDGDGWGWWRRKSWLPDEEPVYEATWYDAAPDQPSLRRVEACDLGVLTCTELWAMDWAGAYGRAGAHIIASPRATGSTSTDNWLAAGRVAAIVSGSYHVSSNRSGNGFGGQGWVFAPDGDLLARTTEDEPFVTVDVDLTTAEHAKTTYPRYAVWTERWAR